MRAKAEKATYTVACPTCRALAGQPCRSLETRRVTDAHRERIQSAAYSVAGSQLAPCSHHGQQHYAASSPCCDHACPVDKPKTRPEETPA